MTAALTRLNHQLAEHAALVDLMQTLLPKVEAVGQAVVAAFARGRRMYTMGNGGSAADALHFAEELLGRYRRTRRALPAASFVSDPTGLTCISNDFGWENVFARQVEGYVQAGDVVIGISTSGNSENVVRALAAARAQGAVTVAFTGSSGGKAASLADHLLNVPSDFTARIQEMHILMIHMICEQVDDWVLGTG